MVDFFAVNPFTMVYTELWTIIEARAEIDELVLVSNRIRYDETRDPHKENISTRDVPEILLAPEGIVSNLKASTNSTTVTKVYGIRISTGDYRYTSYLAQVEWMLFGALVDIRNTLGALQWQGKSFIQSVRIDSNVLGFSDVDDVQRQERKRGWADLMRISVDMRFSQSQLTVQLSTLISPE